VNTIVRVLFFMLIIIVGDLISRYVCQFLYAHTCVIEDTFLLKKNIDGSNNDNHR